MKKILISFVAGLLSLLCVCSFASCDENKVDDGIFAFESGNVKIELGADAKPVLKALGESESKVSNGNCGGLGESTKYVYKGFNLYTLTSADGKETVDQIDFTNDVTETPKGVYLGMSGDDVVKKYGEPTKKTAKLIEYSSGSKFLAFDLDADGNVDAITYGIRSEK